MKLPRRQFLLFVTTLAAILSIASQSAAAQTYPTRPVRWIVGFPPAGASDITARLMGQALSERLGQQFIIDNRPGAGGNIGTEAVAKASPDGYTLLLVNAANASNATLYSNLPFNFMRDITPVAGIIRAPFVLVANPSFSARTVSEFLTYAKANPGKTNMASPGNGSTPHLAGELFKMTTGVTMTHVPYRGGAPALIDLIAGQVQVMFATLPSSIGYIRGGKLRALAVTTAMRSDALPDIPTIGDFVPGYEVSDWNGIGAPKGTPAAIVAKLNKEANAVLADSKVNVRLADVGGTPLVVSPAELGKLIAVDTDKWAKVVKFSGAKAD